MSSEKKKIVVIEDDGAFLEQVTKGLSFGGHDAHVAGNGAVRIGMVRVLKADSGICDMLMPELDGFGTVVLLNQHPDTRDIPVIVFCALGESSTQEFAMKAGVRAYLTKPFMLPDLVATVDAELKMTTDGNG